MNAGNGKRETVAVVGAGIVGICCAAFLVRDGHNVILFDRRGPGEMTSFGNLGGIQSLAATPIGLPGMWKEIPKWLSDQSGPLVIRPSYLPHVAGWLWKFWRQSRSDRVWHNARALNSLNSGSVEAHRSLADWAGVSDLIKVPGQLYVWTSRKYFDGSTLSRKIWASTGHAIREISGAEIREMEPALGDRFEVGLEIPGNGYCRDPYLLARTLADRTIAEGASFRREEVNGFTFDDGRISGVQTDRGVQKVDRLVVAAGMWSKQLLRQLGYEVPLESHRGYHVTIADPGVELSRMLLVIDKKIAITPMNSGLRIGGTVEFAGLEPFPDYRRSRSLLALGKSVLPALEAERYTEWMGHRPCTPDSVPVIGATKRNDNLYLAFGHGHMGLLGSAPTGRLIADLVAGRTPSIDLEPFRVERFGNR
jgi:D-amino-acid dehydrogenase